MTRLRLVGSGAFVVGYLLVQLVFPALAWVRPGYGPFTWICIPVASSARSSP